MIDWKATQTRLGVTPDGIPGIGTYSALLRVVGPKANADTITTIANACAVHFPTYGLDQTVARLADILGQTSNETGGFTDFDENLNYSASRMLEVWGRHFTPATAAASVGKPYEIAEIAYGIKSKTGRGRMGNVRAGDGYNFRGRGMLQLTGRANYTATDRRLGIGLDTNPELAAVPALSLLIACDFYRVNGVLKAIDEGDTDGARRITNAGNRYAKDDSGKLFKPHGLATVDTLRAKLLGVLR